MNGDYSEEFNLSNANTVAEILRAYPQLIAYKPRVLEQESGTFGRLFSNAVWGEQNRLSRRWMVCEKKICMIFVIGTVTWCANLLSKLPKNKNKYRTIQLKCNPFIELPKTDDFRSYWWCASRGDDEACFCRCSFFGIYVEKWMGFFWKNDFKNSH